MLTRCKNSKWIVQSTAFTVQRKLKIRKRKRKEICLQYRFKCWQRYRRRVTFGEREFHVRDAAAGNARSPIVRRRVEGMATANDDAERRLQAVVVWNSRGQHEYLLIYSFKLKSAINAGSLLLMPVSGVLWLNDTKVSDDLIEIYKILTCKENIDSCLLFQRTSRGLLQIWEGTVWNCRKRDLDIIQNFQPNNNWALE